MIELYGHNQAANKAVLMQLLPTGKPAAIHPTGTGKFFFASNKAMECPEALFVHDLLQALYMHNHFTWPSSIQFTMKRRLLNEQKKELYKLFSNTNNVRKKPVSTEKGTQTSCIKESRNKKCLA